MFLKIVQHFAVTERRRADIPTDRMTPRPIAERLRADIECHLDAVTGIVPGPAHPCQIPTLAEIAHPHLWIGFEPAAAEHHRMAGNSFITVDGLHLDPLEAAAAVDCQFACTGLVANLNTEIVGALYQEFDEPGTTADRFNIHAAVKPMLAVDHKGLPSEHRHKAHALFTQPGHGRARPIDQGPREVLVRLMSGNLHQLVVEMIAVMSRQID